MQALITTAFKKLSVKIVDTWILASKGIISQIADFICGICIGGWRVRFWFFQVLTAPQKMYITFLTLPVSQNKL